MSATKKHAHIWNQAELREESNDEEGQTAGVRQSGGRGGGKMQVKENRGE